MRTPKLSNQKKIDCRTILSFFLDSSPMVVQFIQSIFARFTPFIHIAVFAFNYVGSFVSINVCEYKRHQILHNAFQSNMNILQIILHCLMHSENCVHKLFYQSNLYTVSTMFVRRCFYVLVHKPFVSYIHPSTSYPTHTQFSLACLHSHFIIRQLCGRLLLFMFTSRCTSVVNEKNIRTNGKFV